MIQLERMPLGFLCQAAKLADFSVRVKDKNTFHLFQKFKKAFVSSCEKTNNFSITVTQNRVINIMVLFKTLCFYILSILTCGNSLVVQMGASKRKINSDGRLTKAKNAKEDLTPKAKSFAPTTNLAHKNPPTLRQNFNASKANQAKESKTSTTSNEIDSFDRSWIVLDSQVQDFSSDTDKEFSEISALSFGTVLAIEEDGRVNAFASSDVSVLAKPIPPPATVQVINPVVQPVPVPVPARFPVLVPAPTPDIGGDFCWKDSYGRGVGTVPNKCSSDQDLRSYFCYDKCPKGMSRGDAIDCYQTCPDGWRDDVLVCRLAEYSRGTEYTWLPGDPLNNDGMYRRCEADHGKGNCEGTGIIYPKCKEGYTPFGIICHPNSTPDCAALGFLPSNLDLSCAKKSIIGPKPILPGCGDGFQNDAGLCYKDCDTSYDGVGPVCWMKNPPGGVSCGFGSAVNQVECNKVLADQLLSVITNVFKIATLGAGLDANPIVKGSSHWNDMVLKFRDSALKISSWADGNPTAVKTIMVGDMMYSFNDIATLDLERQLPEDIIRIAAAMAAALDPSGPSGIIAAYSYPRCSNGKPVTPAPVPVLKPVVKPVPVPAPSPILVPTPTSVISGDFCWKDSYGRGVGTIPDKCTSDQDYRFFSCYDKCPEGMSRGWNIDCGSVCPDGWRDDGQFCRFAEYWRSAGYPWSPGDWFNDDGMYRRCEADHGKGNCEGSVIVYPKCKAGYYPFTVNICRPNNTPDCAAFGLLPNNFDLSCAKKK